MQTENREVATPRAASALAIIGVVTLVGMIALVLGTAVWFTARHEASPTPPPSAVIKTPPVDPAARAALRSKLMESYRKAADWLARQQGENGAWKSGPVDSPSFTAMILSALAKAPPEIRMAYAGIIQKGFRYLVGAQNPDGTWTEAGGLAKSDATAATLMALSADRAAYKDAIDRALSWVRKSQTLTGLAEGAWGYGDLEIGADGKPKTNQENFRVTDWVAEGAHQAGVPKEDPLWELVVKYAKKNQNSGEVNTDPALIEKLKEAGYEVGEDGGFVYSVGSSKAPPDPNNPKVLRSYAAMTYAGLKVYIYAGLKKDDPAVKAAIRWIKGKDEKGRNRYTVDRHPGFEFDTRERADLRGLFYYYLTMARALEAWGELPLVLEDGSAHDWPMELGAKLVDLQKDAWWQNENKAWWEDQQVLTTSYALNCFDIVLNHVR
jgi:squalene-hopene/tetraprenyl-beta-curcumene cyclase